MRVTKPEHRSHCGSLQRMPANVSVTRKADRRNTLCRPLLTQAVPVGTPSAHGICPIDKPSAHK